MNPETRKRKFVAILQDLLASHCHGVQARLAEQIKIGTSRISRWLSGQVDPINLETLVFFRIAMLKGCSSEELAKSLGFVPPDLDSPQKFQLLLKQMLSNKTQEQLGEILGVSQNAISTWLNPEKTIAPSNIPAGTMFAIARERGWTFDELGIYLGLISQTTTQASFLIKYQLELSELSLAQKQELLVWLLNSINIKINNPNNIQEITTTKCDRSVCIVLEQDDIVIASRYTANLLIHLQLEPENITIATISKAPESLEDLDLLIFDISSEDSHSIPLLENIYFDGDIIVFAPTDLPEAIKESISTNVTEILLKPIDWSQLKDKPYFF